MEIRQKLILFAGIMALTLWFIFAVTSYSEEQQRVEKLKIQRDSLIIKNLEMKHKIDSMKVRIEQYGK